MNSREGKQFKPLSMPWLNTRLAFTVFCNLVCVCLCHLPAPHASFWRSVCWDKGIDAQFRQPLFVTAQSCKYPIKWPGNTALKTFPHFSNTTVLPTARQRAGWQYYKTNLLLGHCDSRRSSVTKTQYVALEHNRAYHHIASVKTEVVHMAESMWRQTQQQRWRGWLMFIQQCILLALQAGCISSLPSLMRTICPKGGWSLINLIRGE